MHSYWRSVVVVAFRVTRQGRRLPSRALSHGRAKNSKVSEQGYLFPLSCLLGSFFLFFFPFSFLSVMKHRL